MKKKSYTVIEILVVLVIIATLAALAWPNYMRIKEKTMNREAKATLALIRAAEKIYRLEQGYYYPYPYLVPPTVDNAADINSYLKLSLPESASVTWAVSIDGSEGTEFSRATRSGPGADGRYWQINFRDDNEPACSPPGPNCP